MALRGMLVLLLGVLTLALGLPVSTAGSAPAAPALKDDPVVSWHYPVPGWTDQDKEEGRVDALLRVGTTVFVGGNFTSTEDRSSPAQTRARTYLSAHDATTGDLAGFAPVLNGRVYALALSPDGSILYVGGDFNTVDGRSQRKLASFHLATGALSPVVPNLDINGKVRAIAVSGTDLFIGGDFTEVAGQRRVRLAKLTSAGGASLGLDSSWQAEADNSIRSIILDDAGGRVVLGGFFDNVNGTRKPGIAAVDRTSGALRAWADHPGAEIFALARAGSTLFAGMGGGGGTALAYDLATGQERWFYHTDGNVQAVTVVDGYPVFGMHGGFVAPVANSTDMTNKVTRKKLFVLDPASGGLLDWAPQFQKQVGTKEGVLGIWSLHSASGALYAGGDFVKVNGLAQSRFAIFLPVRTPSGGGDQVAPSAAITAPAADSTVGGTIDVEVDAADNVGVSRVDLLVDGAAVASVAAPPFTFPLDTTGLANGSHVLRARAVDEAGNVGLSAEVGIVVDNVVPDTTPPSAPGGLTAAASSPSEVHLSWSAATDDREVAGYLVERGGLLIARTGVTSFDDTGLVPQTTYGYVVRAEDAAGNVGAASQVATVTTPAAPDMTPPSAPGSLTAVALSPTQVDLSWAPATDAAGVAGYEVLRDGGLLATVASTSFGDWTATPATTHTYSVRAVDGAGNVGPATTSSVTTPALATGIRLKGQTLKSAYGDRISLSRPETREGWMMIATITVRGKPTVTAPSGWTRIQSTRTADGRLSQVSYYRVATPAEPAAYTWKFTGSHAAAGGLLALRGVDVSAPIVASSQRASDPSRSIVAPGVSSPVAGAMIVGAFGIADDATPIDGPDGMTEVGEVDIQDRSAVALEIATELQAYPGLMGKRTATAAKADSNVGHLIVLRPAA